MKWTRIFRIFESTREGRSSALSGFSHALKTLFPAQTGSRRPKAEACGPAERLEVRQVLSVANPAVVMNGAAMGEPEPSDSRFDAPTPEQTATVEAVGKADPVAAEQDDSQSLQPDWAESDSIWNLADLSSANRSSFPTSSMDESVAPASTVLPVTAGLAPSPNTPIPLIAAPLVQNALGILPATDPVFAIPVPANSASVSMAATSAASGWNWRTSSSPEFAVRPPQTATVTAQQSLAVPETGARSVGRLSLVPVDGDADHGWLAGLTEITWFSADYDPSASRILSSPVAADMLPVAVPLVNHGVDQQLSSQNLTITAQAKVRSFREGNRQNSTSTKLIEVRQQHDSLQDLIDSEDVPRALKFVVLPRGPPRKQPDTVLRIMDSDAEAHVLQRLRYSMAPRGPSTVTVEMQSPEKRSFSGPRVSPEESLSVRLAC